MAVTSCSDAVFDAFYSDTLADGFFHGHTYTANPLACTAALAGIELLLSDEIQEGIDRIKTSHKEFLEGISNHPKITDSRQCGVILALDLATARPPDAELECDPRIDALLASREEARSRKDWAEADRIRDALAAEGIFAFFLESGFLAILLFDTGRPSPWPFAIGAYFLGGIVLLLLGALVGPALYRTEPLLDLLGLDPVTHDKSLGYLQAVAAWLNLSLEAQVATYQGQAAASDEAVYAALEVDGINFGNATFWPDGSIDTAGLRAISEDFVVRPFGHKGRHRNLTELVDEALLERPRLPKLRRPPAPTSGSDATNRPTRPVAASGRRARGISAC